MKKKNKNMQINMQVALDTTCTSHKQKKISPSRLQQRRLRKNAMKSLDRRDLSSTITESRLQFSRTSSCKSSCKWLRTEHPQTCTNKQTNKQTCTNIKWLRTEHAQTTMNLTYPHQTSTVSVFHSLSSLYHLFA